MSEKDFLKNLLDEMVVDGLFTEDESSELLEMLVQECQGKKSHED